MPPFRPIVYLSVFTFVASFLVCWFWVLPLCGIQYDSSHFQWYLLPIYFVFVNVTLKLFLRGFEYEVAIRSVFLGSVLALGATLSSTGAPQTWCAFGWYTCVMAVFHFSEFLAIAVTNPATLSLDSFILNHSKEYGIAAVTSWTEFYVEQWLFPGMKDHMYVSMIGLAMCIGGETLRKLAMWTARTNFNHVVQVKHEASHELVTHGVYEYFRHPSYVGWFYWSVGTQIILLNPLCFVAYAAASWKFFNDRVEHEEISLLHFFGEAYRQYQQRVPTGLPYIHGYKLDQ